MLKVLGLCSGRKHGNTEMMMKEAFMAIEEKIEEVECQLIRVQETEINTCKMMAMEVCAPGGGYIMTNSIFSL